MVQNLASLIPALLAQDLINITRGLTRQSNCEKYVQRDYSISNLNSLYSHSVVISEIYSHAFWQKFRETSVFTKEITKKMIS